MPNPRWYLQRLSAMSPLELPHRAGRLLRSRLEGLRRRPVAADLDLDRVRVGDRYGVFPSAADWTPARRDHCLAEADRALEGRLVLFGSLPLGPGVHENWNRDPVSGRVAPLENAARLDHRDTRLVGDVRVTWELNRMQHLVRLAQAWDLSGEEVYAREVARQIGHWIEQCPAGRGVNWTSPMEAGLRLISWTWAFELIRRWPALAEGFVGLLTRSVHQHLDFIHRNYSLYSSANNHLIAEASGVFIAAGYWAGLRRAAVWRSRARRHLIRECARQNWSDGVNREQSFGYQAFVLELLSLAAEAAEAGGDPFPGEYHGRLQQMTRFLEALTDRRGSIPAVGDDDGGRALAPGVGGTGAPAGKAPAGRLFRRGGYAVLRHRSGEEGEALLLFDAGPLGWPATAVHGHADALSVWLHLDGRPFLVDSGTCNYREGAVRTALRGTAAHNTLAFPGQDQGRQLNRFAWGRKPRVLFSGGELTGGVERLGGDVTWWTGARHERRLEWRPEEQLLLIHDRWAGPAAPDIHFHLAPGLDARLEGGTVAVAGGGCRLEISCADAPVVLEPCRISPRPYEMTDAWRVRISPGAARGECRIRIGWQCPGLS